MDHFQHRPGCQQINICLYPEKAFSVAVVFVYIWSSKKLCWISTLWLFPHLLSCPLAYMIPAIVLRRIKGAGEGIIYWLSSGGQWPPSGRSLANPLVSLTTGPEGSCCQESKVVVTLTAGLQHAYVSLGPHVTLGCDACVFIPAARCSKVDTAHVYSICPHKESGLDLQRSACFLPLLLSPTSTDGTVYPTGKTPREDSIIPDMGKVLSK